MTKSTITRERIEQIVYFRRTLSLPPSHDEIEELARMALAAMDSEPVAWTWHYREQWHVTNDERRAEFVAKDGDVAVLPLYRHAQPAPMVMQSEPAIADCDPEVYEKGVSVCLVAIPKETAEVICQNITAATGCKVDWHYFGGRVHIKALRVASQPAPVVPDDVLDALQKVARIRLDLNDFDGDRRGIADCLGDAEEAFIEVVNRRASMLAAAPQEVPDGK
ncbi:hypothetical protein NUKP82_07180 [Klebsiella variicola]|uniref:hypothetical protein n=1 Tax=Klebsiella pneumoniae complex TaxID=3390273 RepID=UPI0015A73E67|nr:MULTISPECIES: hypothetical protein [Klebsiella]GKN15502.1 hypothetical protein NUKP82_07180 [Klebsiella variicola]HCI8564529.1 hypothetical protein [Klebsiella variicola]